MAPGIRLDGYQTFVAASLVLLAGRLLLARLALLRTFSIPEPVAGGVAAAAVAVGLLFAMVLGGMNYNNNLAYVNANNQAQSQIFNQNLAAANFQNAAQQQAMSQALQQRQLPLNEIAALMSGQQIQNPQFQPYQGQTTQAGNIQGAVQQQGQWDQNIYNQQVAQRNGLLGAIGGLAGTATGGLFSLGAAGKLNHNQTSAVKHA